MFSRHRPHRPRRACALSVLYPDLYRSRAIFVSPECPFPPRARFALLVLCDRALCATRPAQGNRLPLRCEIMAPLRFSCPFAERAKASRGSSWFARFDVKLMNFPVRSESLQARCKHREESSRLSFAPADIGNFLRLNLKNKYSIETKSRIRENMSPGDLPVELALRRVSRL